MEKYMHNRFDKPKDGAIIVVLRGKLPKIVQMSELYWGLNNSFITGWYYADELAEDAKNLSKYVRAYNSYRDSVKELMESVDDAKLVEKLLNMYETATKMVTDD